jgi:hypothetical protein
MSHISLIKQLQQTNLSDQSVPNSQSNSITDASSQTTSFESIKDALWNSFKISIQNVGFFYYQK